MDGDSADHQPSTLDVGITGHRLVRLDPALAQGLPPVIDAVLAKLRDSLRIDTAAAPAKATMWLHTGLATGADQLAASSGHALGYRVRAVLPFAAAQYREDFAPGGERAEFDRQLAAADTVLALPCDRDGSDTGYVMAGKAIVAAADVLVAVWDGDIAENAEGGTAYVVALATDEGVPVIHIVVDRASARIGPAVLLTPAGSTPLENAADLDALFGAIFARKAARP